MSTNNGSAEIYDMEDARARRRSAPPGADDLDVGAHLAAVREAMGLSVAQAADKIHIRQRHLEAIETLDMENLPPRPYAIGFVRAYAEFLGLEASPIVSRFKEDADYGAPAPADVEKFETTRTPAAPESREMSLAAVIAIIAFFIWCAFQITLLDGAHRRAGAASDETAASTRLPPPPEPAPADIIEARVIERIEPIYPRGCIADASPLETVVIGFTITTAGRVVGERVAQSTNGCFNAAALNAVRRWRFEPRLVEGTPRPLYDQKYSFSFARPR